MESVQLTTLYGQLTILVTTLAGFLYTIYRETRNRRWDLEDRAQALRDLKADLKADAKHEKEELSTHVTAQQMMLRHDSDQKQNVILQKIDENTRISESAFKEANDVNQKIAKLAEAYNQVKGRTTSLEQVNVNEEKEEKKKEKQS